MRLINKSEKFLGFGLLVVILLGSYYSLFLRNFQENLDDKVNFYLASLPNSRSYLERQLEKLGDNSVYGYWRVGLLDNYPILKYFYKIQYELINYNISRIYEVLLASSIFLFILSSLSIFLFGYVLFRSKNYTKFSFAFIIFISSVVFAVVSTYLGYVMKNRLASLGIVGLDTAPYGLSIIGSLLSAGLDLSFVGSTPRGSALLCIMSMWVALLTNQNRMAIFSAALAFTFHISYGVIGILILYTFLILSKTNTRFSFSLQLVVLMGYTQFQLFIYRPPGNFIYSAVLLSFHLFYYLICKLSHMFTIRKFDMEKFVYITYLSAAILKIALLPELGLVKNLEEILGFRDGWALFITDFPRRISLITAPLVILTISYNRLSFIGEKYKKYMTVFALAAIIVITSIFGFSALNTGFPISDSIQNLDVGSGTRIYLETLEKILKS